MSKQSDIREGMSWILAEIYQKGKSHSTINYKDYSGQILEYLHSQGVVIKADKKLPDITEFMVGITSPLEAYKAGQKDAQFTMKEAGYVVVESLIKERE